MPPKVAMLCTQMEFGGVQIRALELKKYIEQRGGVADIFFLYKKRSITENLNGIFCLIEGKPKGPLQVLIAIIKLLFTLRRGRYDAVIGFAHYSSPIACTLGLLAGIPARIATQTNPPYRDKIGAIPLDWLCGVSGIYTSNIAASKSIADCFVSYPWRYRNKIKVIYNGIRKIVPRLSRSEARSKLGVADDDILLLNCGRLSAQKNQAFLVDVVNHLPDKFKLKIVGEGELHEDLISQIQRSPSQAKIELLGGFEPSSLGDILIAGDVFLFPSHFEAFGLAMVEAMSVGLPVICSNYPALLEVGGDAVEAVSVTSAIEWAAEIKGLTEESRRRRASEQSLSRAGEFTIDAMCAGFLREARVLDRLQ